MEKVNSLNQNEREEFVFIDRARKFIKKTRLTHEYTLYLQNQNEAIVRHIGNPAYSHGDGICNFIIENHSDAEPAVCEVTI